MRSLVIVGAGGFGRETIDTVHAINAAKPTWQLLGVVDDAPSSKNLARLSVLGLHHLGTVKNIPAGADVAIGVGNPTGRRHLARVLRDRGHGFPSLIHPSATVGTAFLHGEGLVVLAGVSIGTNVVLGDHAHLNAHAVLGHDVRIDDFVSINPNATISGDCFIGSGALLGAACTVLPGLRVGQDVTVGAAACVVTDVPTNSVVKGVPAR